MKKMIGIILVLSFITSASAAYASRGDAIQQGRDVIAIVERQTSYCAQETFTTDFIGLGQTKFYNTFLYSGVDYIIAVGGDGNAKDLDVGLADQSGNTIIDNSNSKEGLIKFGVRVGGNFTLGVKLANGSRKGAWIYIIHFYQC